MPRLPQRPIHPVDRRSEPLKAEAIARDERFAGALAADPADERFPPLQEPYGHSELGTADPAMPAVEERLTADHDAIRGWAEALGGAPALVSRTDDTADATLRIVFAGSTGPMERVEPVEWAVFFEWLDDADMALRHVEGSRQHRLIRRTGEAIRRAAATTNH